ncbi:MAG: S41 family peptidase [Bacilli bacterium]|nr:S41 family peptidase [Bacilli bacterium]
MDKMKKVLNNLRKDRNLYSLKFVIICSVVVAVLASVITGVVILNFTSLKAVGNKQLMDVINTYDKIKREYYETINDSDLATSAIDGMMSFLEEKYSIYMDQDDTDYLTDKLKGNYEGLGIGVIKNAKKEIIILNVYDNTPASEAGLKTNDVILEVNGKKITDKNEASDIAEMIKKTKKVNIKVRRDNKTMDFDIEKKTVEYPVVGTQVFEKNNKKIGYLELTSFNATADKQVSNSLKKLESEQIDSLIIDLRGNTGGYLSMANSIANMFLKKGKVIYSLEGKTTRNTVTDTTDEERNYDIVVLIDSITASASEILAAALKESYGAILVGTTSYGKGKVQQTTTLSDDTMIKYTTAKWFTPRGDNIDTIGLTPGIEVYLTKEYLVNPTSENDAQLMKAIEVLSRDENTIK